MKLTALVLLVSLLALLVFGVLCSILTEVESSSSPLLPIPSNSGEGVRYSLFTDMVQ
jgi:hypothetical protein